MNRIINCFRKYLLCILLFLLMFGMCSSNGNYKKYLYRKIYQDCFDFSYIKGFYNNYMGGIFPIEGIYNKQSIGVFREELSYSSVVDYYDGGSLGVNYNYVVPARVSGIVVYVGNKDNYGNVVIVNGDDGIDYWYGNLCNVMVKLYDTLDKGSYVGEVCDNKLYFVVTKKNEFLNYRDYL